MGHSCCPFHAPDQVEFALRITAPASPAAMDPA